MAAIKSGMKIENMSFVMNVSSHLRFIMCSGQRSITFSGQFPRFSCPILSRKIHTTAPVEKRQSPRTVGIPAWKKASIDRKQFVAKLRKPKNEETIKAEMRLENKDKEISLFTTSRIRRVPKEKETVTRLQPEIFLSKDGQTIICYHPTPNYPKAKTRPSWERPLWYGERSIVGNYSDDMTEEQITEAQRLREADARLWSASTLGHMMKVKPSVVSEKLPFTSEQMFELDVERKLLKEWGRSKKIDYKKYQNQEILEYIRETRGENAVLEYRKVFDI